jgi:hypothetical protein
MSRDLLSRNPTTGMASLSRAPPPASPPRRRKA